MYVYIYIYTSICVYIYVYIYIMYDMYTYVYTYIIYYDTSRSNGLYQSSWPMEPKLLRKYGLAMI